MSLYFAFLMVSYGLLVLGPAEKKFLVVPEVPSIRFPPSPLIPAFLSCSKVAARKRRLQRKSPALPPSWPVQPHSPTSDLERISPNAPFSVFFSLRSKDISAIPQELFVEY